MFNVERRSTHRYLFVDINKEIRQEEIYSIFFTLQGLFLYKHDRKHK